MNAPDLHRHACIVDGCAGVECFGDRLEGCGHSGRGYFDGCPWAREPMRCPDVALNLDLAQEDRPDPRWLRQLASTLKLEADLLKGHSEAMPTNKPTRAAVAILASIHMGQASDCLTQLADLIDAAPPDHAVAFLPRVNASLADTACLPPLSHAGGGPGSLPGREAASGSPAAGRPLLESDGA